MQEPKYQIAFWLTAGEKTQVEDLKKQGLSHHDIFVVGLDNVQANKAQQPKAKKKQSKDIENAIRGLKI